MWLWMFPGQGSQFLGMGKIFYENFKESKEIFEEASDTLKIDFKKLCFEGPESELQLTKNTQPCLLTVSTAIWKIFKKNISNNSFGAGHSLGEYSALVAAGTLQFSDALKAVRQRGEFMQQAVPEGQGAMAAVLGLEEEQVIRLCEYASKETNEVVEPANFNAPGQVVISGSAHAIEWLKTNFNPQVLGLKRLKLVPLKVSAPFHCSLMKPAEDRMASVLSQIKFTDWKFPIIQNRTARPAKSLEELQKNLKEQISSPVKWSQSILYLKEQGITHAVEVGCGSVLVGLMKKIDSGSIQTFNIQNLDDLKKLEKLL